MIVEEFPKGIFHKRPLQFLIWIKQANGSKHNYCARMCKDLNCTTTHATKILSDLYQLKLITNHDFDGKGDPRKKYLKLTSRGISVADNLIKILDVLQK